MAEGQTETLNQPASANAALPDLRADNVIAPQSGDGNCGCGSTPESDSNGRATVSFVYAIGRIEARFPNLAAEKEFAQATIPSTSPAFALATNSRAKSWGSRAKSLLILSLADDDSWCWASYVDGPKGRGPGRHCEPQAKQSRAAWLPLDCFVASLLARTVSVWVLIRRLGI